MALHLQSVGISTCDSVTSFLYGTAVIQIGGPLLALRSGAQDSHCPHVERVEEWRDPSLDPLAPSMKEGTSVFPVHHSINVSKDWKHWKDCAPWGEHGHAIHPPGPHTCSFTNVQVSLALDLWQACNWRKAA